MTANAMAGDRDRCIEAGMNDHVAKPIDPEVLWTKLLQWIKPRAAPLPKVGAGDTAPQAGGALLKLLSGLPGLDAARGLYLSLGRPELYLSLLRKFVASQRDFAGALAAAAEAQDWPAAQRLAHTLKGVAGQIGAAPLSDMAEQLEAAIGRREPAASLDPLQREIAGHLRELTDAIASRLPEAQRAPAAAAVDAKLFDAVCARLAQQLADDDFASGALLDENEAMLRAGLGEHFAGIAEAVHEFNFTAALDQLNEAIAGRNVG